MIDRIIYPDFTSSDVISKTKKVQADIKKKYNEYFTNYVWRPAADRLNRLFDIMTVFGVLAAISLVEMAVCFILAFITKSERVLTAGVIGIACCIVFMLIAMVMSYVESNLNEREAKNIQKYLDEYVIREMIGHGLFVPFSKFIEEDLKSRSYIDCMHHAEYGARFLTVDEDSSLLDNDLAMYYPYMDLLCNIERMKDFCGNNENLSYRIIFEDLKDGQNISILAIDKDACYERKFPLGHLYSKWINEMCKYSDTLDFSFLNETRVTEQYDEQRFLDYKNSQEMLQKYKRDHKL